MGDKHLPLPLVALTLQGPSYVAAAVLGHFSGGKEADDEVAVIRGSSHLEVLAFTRDGYRLVTQAQTNTFSTLRTLKVFRPIGHTKDLILLGSDSGAITLVEYMPDTKSFQVVASRVLGPPGCHLHIPGQYVAADPHGMAVFVGGVEDGAKAVLMVAPEGGGDKGDKPHPSSHYVFRDPATDVAGPSSPRDALPAIVFDVVGLDVGKDENPTFAVLEKPSGGTELMEEKSVVFYELEVAKNELRRSERQVTSSRAFFLLSVPGKHRYGPGGVLVLSENWIAYKNRTVRGKGGEIRAPFPRPAGLPESMGVLPIAACPMPLTSKTGGGGEEGKAPPFFWLVQSEYGHVYRVWLEGSAPDVEIKIKPLDSLPPSNALILNTAGILWAASDAGDHCLYEVKKLGEADKTTARSSFKVDGDSAVIHDDPASAKRVAPEFTPSKTLQYFQESIMEPTPTLSPLTAICPLHQKKLLLALCGRGGSQRSKARVLTGGMAVEEHVNVPLPPGVAGVWAVTDAKGERMLILSYPGKAEADPSTTLVLSMGEVLKETTDSPFLTSEPTLLVYPLMAVGDSGPSFVQVVKTTVRHIKEDGTVVDHKGMGRREMDHVACNGVQLVAARSLGGELYFFEMDEEGGLSQLGKTTLELDITAVHLPPVKNADDPKPRYLLVQGYDNKLRIMTYRVNSQNEVTCMAHSSYEASVGISSLYLAPDIGQNSTNTLFLGLNSGTMLEFSLRTLPDQDAPSFTDSDPPQSRVLGTKPVKLVPMPIRGEPGMLALSSRSWLVWQQQPERTRAVPWAYDPFDCASPITLPNYPEAVVGFVGSTLRIVTVVDYGSPFSIEGLALKQTPRKMAITAGQELAAVIESDYREAKSDEEGGGEAPMDVDAGEEEEGEEAYDCGKRPEGEGHWASCIRLMDPATAGSPPKGVVRLEDGEAALSLEFVRFQGLPQQLFLVVGVAKGLCPTNPNKAVPSYLILYTVLPGGELREEHRTEVEAPPRAIRAFSENGTVLVGVGSTLRMYGLGKKKLLRRVEYPRLSHTILDIHHRGKRIFTSDLLRGVCCLQYHRADNSLTLLADDAVPRLMTALCPLDDKRVVGANKLGNIFILGLPPEVNNRAMGHDDGAIKTYWEVCGHKKVGTSAPHKFQTLAEYHVGEMVTSVVTLPFGPSSDNPAVVMYGTIMGSLGVLCKPSAKGGDGDGEGTSLWRQLEAAMRKHAGDDRFLTKRDHMLYRSYFSPVQEVVDGDLCEAVGSLKPDKLRSVAKALKLKPVDLVRKVEELKTRVMLM